MILVNGKWFSGTGHYHQALEWRARYNSIHTRRWKHSKHQLNQRDCKNINTCSIPVSLRCRTYFFLRCLTTVFRWKIKAFSNWNILSNWRSLLNSHCKWYARKIIASYWLTLRRTSRGGEVVATSLWVFLFFFLEDKKSAPDIFSSCTFIPRHVLKKF